MEYEATPDTLMGRRTLVTIARENMANIGYLLLIARCWSLDYFEIVFSLQHRPIVW